jgi:hypothetical protein
MALVGKPRWQARYKASGGKSNVFHNVDSSSSSLVLGRTIFRHLDALREAPIEGYYGKSTHNLMMKTPQCSRLFGAARGEMIS